MCYKVENVDNYGFVVAPEVVIEYTEDLQELMFDDDIPEVMFDYFYNLGWGPEFDLDYESTDFQLTLDEIDVVNAFLDNYMSD